MNLTVFDQKQKRSNNKRVPRMKPKPSVSVRNKLNYFTFLKPRFFGENANRKSRSVLAVRQWQLHISATDL